MRNAKQKLTTEIVGGESYEYYPLGKYIVATPGGCGGRPTFKYTRRDEFWWAVPTLQIPQYWGDNSMPEYR